MTFSTVLCGSLVTGLSAMTMSTT